MTAPRTGWFPLCAVRWATSLLVASLFAPPPSLAADRPNVLFIMSDDHAYQSISAYGHKVNGQTLNETPNIDRIAQGGMRFDRSFVTNSICGPCRAVILTGKYSHLNGFRQNGDRFDGSQQTFPKLLQQAGYQTAVFGKWHLESDPTGFDAWNVLIDQGPYYNPPMKGPGGVKKYEGYTTDIITDQTLDWLKNGRDPNKPFFLACQHKAPHRDWLPALRHLDLYEDRDMPEPATLFDDYATRKAAADQEMTIARHMRPSDLKLTTPSRLTPEQKAVWEKAYGPRNEAFKKQNLSGKELVRWNYQRYIKDYLRCVKAVDEGVGRVLDYLDESGLAKNTIVVYTADQGFYLGEHGWYDKRWMYEESLRTPLLIRWPGVTKPGSVNTDMVLNLDHAETILDAAGVKIPADMQGRSLAPVLAGNTPDDWRSSIYYHYYEYPIWHRVQPHFGVRTDGYKLIRYPMIDDWELFDLEADPHELTDVYGKPEYAKQQAELKDQLEALRKKYKDTEKVAAGNKGG